MTGEAPGKIKIPDAKVFITRQNNTYELLDPKIYIHLKGYSYAKVTHLDIEHRDLNNIIQGKGGYFKIEGIPYGIVIHITKGKRIVLRHKLLNEILGDNESLYTWVGSKIDGIYIGFKKEYISKLEKLASKLASSNAKN